MVKGMVISAGLLLSGTPGYCLQQLPLVNHQQTRIEISLHEMNRIAIKEDRIKQVFGMDDRLVIEVDEESGQIFLKPRELAFSGAFASNKGRSINLTLITEKGLTHDLRLLPTAKATESVLFYQELEPSMQKQAKPQDRAARIARFVREMQQDLARQDLSRQELSGQELSQQRLSGLAVVKLPLIQVDRCYGEELRLSPLLQYNNGEFAGNVYLLGNICKHHQFLQESGLAMAGDLAIAVLRQNLAPNEQTHLFVVRNAVEAET
ncbi:MAG: type-F conjugative transfer system secretin TraK [Pseudomonadota bacterium]